MRVLLSSRRYINKKLKIIQARRQTPEGLCWARTCGWKKNEKLKKHATDPSLPYLRSIYNNYMNDFTIRNFVIFSLSYKKMFNQCRMLEKKYIIIIRIII